MYCFTVTHPPLEYSSSSSVDVPLTVPSAKLNPQEEFEKNMERLSNILASYPSAEPQRSSASSWSFRQQKASDRWKEARPYHLKCLIAKEAVGHPLCWLCHEPAVIRCTECLPEEWFCGECDVLRHKKQPLHNRECVIHGFFEAIPPTSYAIKGEDGYRIHEQGLVCSHESHHFAVHVPDCSCESTNFTILPGKPVILITINEKNMERLSNILASYPSAEPQRSSASSWSFRQQKASDRWKEARPYHLKCLIAKEAVGHPLCWLCHEPAVIRCTECLPEEWFCGECDVLRQPLHNRECIIHGLHFANCEGARLLL
ncbi:Protocadherin-9 [Labeo rohita]|uniref:Protocadherin-9 n=1 Tax=Labeo rohita TaxID=84645 RepID=A0ABQ8L8Q9_LABRO|nr:Protocadherin-9 [Labeo rohita]